MWRFTHHPPLPSTPNNTDHQPTPINTTTDSKPNQPQVEDIPLGLCEFQGRLLVGSGKALSIYDLGKKKLLRKVTRRQPTNRLTHKRTKSIRDLPTD
jgi:hypothetical protein